MSPFTVLTLCVQACLIQTVLSQCGCGSSLASYLAPAIGIGNYGGYAGYSTPAIGLSNSGSCGAYGGNGEGTVSVAGPINACGTTCVTGSVPVLGAVTFGGCVDAYGAVSITGQCGCGCGIQ